MLQFRGELCYASLSTSISYIARRLVTYLAVRSKSVDAYVITHHVCAPGSEQVVTQVVKIRRAEFKLFVTVVRQVCQFALKIAGWDGCATWCISRSLSTWHSCFIMSTRFRLQPSHRSGSALIITSFRRARYTLTARWTLKLEEQAVLIRTCSHSDR